MADWLERARREIPRGADRATANTDERSLTAVTAVPQPTGSGIPEPSIGSNGSSPQAVFPKKGEAAIRAWLASIGETDPEIVAEVMEKCLTDSEARGYFLGRAEEIAKPL